MFNPRSGLVAAFLVMSQTVTLGAQAADKCIRPKEVEADKVRYIEAQLHVAALQCRDQQHAKLPTLYNAFIMENRPHLVRTQKPLKSYVNRSGQNSIAGYLEAVASRVSIESVKVNQFCNRAMLVAELSAKTAHPVKLLGLMPVQYQRPADLCRTKG